MSDAYNLFGQVMERGSQNLVILKNKVNQVQNKLKQAEGERQEAISDCIKQLENLRGE